MRISNSQKDKYLQCGEKWRLHYQERLRSPRVSSSLFFGNALDEAFSRLLLDKKKELTDHEKELVKFTPEELFHQKMLQVENDARQKVDLPKSPLADYYNSDFTESLLLPQHLELLQAVEANIQNLAGFKTFMEECRATLKAKKKLSQEDKVLYNYTTWLTLCEKGKLMIDAYRTQVMPQIYEVFTVQKEVELSNGPYSITGKIDFIASFTADPSRKYICDNKSSSKPYKADSVLESEQLSTYCEAEQIFDAAYIVVEKTLYKKKPVVHTQIIKNTIPEETFVSTFAEYDNMIKQIEEGKFEKNWGSCFDYGVMCPYYSLCKHKSKGNLIQLEQKKDE